MKCFTGLSLGVLTAVGLNQPLHAQLLHSFNSYATDGANPGGGILAAAGGLLYGTTFNGGANGHGAVYRIQPPGKEEVIWSFGGGPADGKDPAGDLLMDKVGAIYGVTGHGGASDVGTVYRLTPPQSGSSDWPETILYSFDSVHGSGPNGGLIADPSGNLYGVAGGGGVGDSGLVFELVAPAPSQTQWSEKVLYSFVPFSTDGIVPQCRLYMDVSGNLFGTTLYGGLYGFGTVFKLSPPPGGQTSWAERVLYSFDGTTSGGYPMAGLTPAGPRGGFYGTTSGGGPGGGGTVFQLQVPSAGGFSVLHAFTPSTNDGATSLAAVTVMPSGDLYGTTEKGGADDGGTIFKLAPSSGGDGQWTETVVSEPYQGGDSGYDSHAELTAGKNGILYGTNFAGGLYYQGTTFSFSSAR